jgi:hypothetical protein
MTGRDLPAALPPGFHEIWRALSAADAEASSRQVLARELGLSTHTIQRILVDGDVPDLLSTRNLRVIRAWVRIITRLAHRFGRDPRAWVETAGVAWDESVAALVEDTLGGLAPRAGAPLSDAAPDGRPRAMRVSVSGYRMPDEIRVGVSARGALGLVVASSGRPFLETYTARLVGVIEPQCRVRFAAADTGDIGEVLSGENPEADMMAGVAATLAGSIAGVDFVSLPGLKMKLSALCLRKRDQEALPPAWYEATSPAMSADTRFLVAGDREAVRFLKGQCGVPEERLIIRDQTGPEDIAEMLVRESSLWESSMHRRRWVILVGSEDVCDLVESALEERGDVMGAYSVERPAGDALDYPAYQVAIALPAWRRELRDLLEAATRFDMFGSGAAHTARLFAEMVAAGFTWRNMGNLINPCLTRGPNVVYDFPLAGSVFRSVFSRELIRMLVEGIGEALTAREVFRTPAAISAQAGYLAAQHAMNLMPPAWKAAAGVAEAGAGSLIGPGLLRVPAGHCQSCTASLLDEGHRGASDRYCRICSDETGALRPRAEVAEVMADLFARWHGALDRAEALRQAREFMEHMPAWCKN